MMHQPGAARLGEKLRSEADQTAGGNAEFQSDSAAAVIDHLRHRPLADAHLGDDHALKFFGHVDDEVLDRLHLHAVHFTCDDVRT